MIQLSSLMWAFAIFFAMIGFMRGWSREIVSTAGIVLAAFVLFQADSILRGYLFVIMDRDQAFIFQSLLFISLTYAVYQSPEFEGRRGTVGITESVLGGLMGFFNGYLVGGSLWYFLDINEYPLSQYVTAPAINSPSADALNQIPLLIVGGGASGSGDFLAVIVIGLLFLVLLS